MRTYFKKQIIEAISYWEKQLLLLENARKAKRLFSYEFISQSDLTEVSKDEFQSQLSSYQIQSSIYEFSKNEVSNIWFRKIDSLKIQTCKKNSFSGSGMTFLIETIQGKQHFYVFDMTLNQLLTLLLNTNEQYFDCSLCKNLFGNYKKNLTETDQIYNFNVIEDLKQFFKLKNKYDDEKYVKSILKLQLPRSKRNQIDGCHFFFDHKIRAERIIEKIYADNFDIGNIIGYIYPAQEEILRFSSISILTDKNYLIMYSSNLTDDKGEPLNTGYKIFDMFVMSVCQVVNKMSRIDKYVNTALKGKIPRKQIELAIEQEKNGLAMV